MLFQLDQLHATISEPLGEDVALKGMIRNPPPSSTPAAGRGNSGLPTSSLVKKATEMSASSNSSVITDQKRNG